MSEEIIRGYQIGGSYIIYLVKLSERVIRAEILRRGNVKYSFGYDSPDELFSLHAEISDSTNENHHLLARAISITIDLDDVGSYEEVDGYYIKEVDIDVEYTKEKFVEIGPKVEKLMILADVEQLYAPESFVQEIQKERYGICIAKEAFELTSADRDNFITPDGKYGENPLADAFIAGKAII